MSAVSEKPGGICQADKQYEERASARGLSQVKREAVGLSCSSSHDVAGNRPYRVSAIDYLGAGY